MRISHRLAEYIQRLDRIVFPNSISPVTIFECTPEELKRHVKEHKPSGSIAASELIIDTKALAKFLVEGDQTSGPLVDALAQHLRQCYEKGEIPFAVYLFSNVNFDLYLIFDYGDIMKKLIQRESKIGSLTEEEYLIVTAAHEVRHKVQNRILALPKKVHEAEMKTISTAVLKIWRQYHDLQKIAELIR